MAQSVSYPMKVLFTDSQTEALRKNGVQGVDVARIAATHVSKDPTFEAKVQATASAIASFVETQGSMPKDLNKVLKAADIAERISQLRNLKERLSGLSVGTEAVDDQLEQAEAEYERATA